MKNKRFMSAVLCLVLVASLFTGFVSTASAEDVITYTVKNGDYLLRVCKSLGLDYYQCKNAIMILNGYTSDSQLNQLTVGREIKLPATNAIAATVTGSSSTTTTVATSTTVNGVTTTTTSSSTVNGVQSGYSVAYYLIPHVVKSGETLAGICNAYGTTYAQYANIILAVNGFSSPNYVWAGKTVYIPSSKAPSAGSCYAVVAHTVKSGETLTSICSSYGTSYTANSKMVNGLNYGKNLGTIYVGQTIYVPVVATVSAAAAASTTASTAVSVQSGCYIDFETSVVGGGTTNVGSPYAELNGTAVSRSDVGNTVTIIPNPKYGYAQKSVAVYRSDNSADVIVKNNQFVMPACDVVVDVVYQEAKSITKTPTKFGMIKTLVNGVEADFAIANDEVVLSFTTDYGYSCASAHYTYVDESNTTITVPIYQQEDGTWSFVMPDENITVVVEMAKGASLQQLKTDIEIVNMTDYSRTADTSKKTASVEYYVNGSVCTKAAVGTQVMVGFEPAENYGIYAIYVNGGAVTYTQVDDDCIVFMMPAGGATVTIETYYSVWWSLQDWSDEGGTIVFTNINGEVIDSAQVDDEVHVLFKPYSNYVYKDGSLEVLYADGYAKIPATQVDPSVFNEYKFTMVDANVGATVTWEEDTSEQNYIYSDDYHHGDCDIWVTPAGGKEMRAKTAEEGDLVTVYVTGYTGYICTSLIACKESTGEPVMDSTQSGSWTINYEPDNSKAIASGSFKMPADTNVYVEAEFTWEDQYVNIYNYGYGTYGGSHPEGKVIAFVNDCATESAIVGSTIEIVAKPEDGYSLASLSLYRANDDTYVNLSVSDNWAEYTIRTEDYNADSAAKNYIELIPQFECTNGYAINNGGDGYSVSHVSAGQNVLITLTADPSKQFADDGHVIYYGTESDGSRVDITDYVISADYSTITFNMPEGNVYLDMKTEALTGWNVNTSGGSYTANPATSVIKGETVTLTAGSGYRFKESPDVLTCASGSIPYTMNADRTVVTFTMPYSDVTVDWKTDSISTYSVTYTGTGYDKLALGTEDVEPGTTVTVTADEGLCFDKKDVTTTGVSIKSDNFSKDNTSFSFTMPSALVTVDATAKYPIVNHGTGYTVDRTAGTYGDTVTLTPDAGYKFGMIAALCINRDGEEYYKLAYTENPDGTIAFTLPDEFKEPDKYTYEVMIRADVQESAHEIDYDGTGFTFSTLTAAAGTTITITADKGLRFNEVYALYDVLPGGAKHNNIIPTTYADSKGNVYKLEFTMPENDVYFSADMEGIDYSITLNGKPYGETFEYGDTAYVWATDGYLFQIVTSVTGVSTGMPVLYSLDEDNSRIWFEMPAEDVIISATETH